MTHCLVQEKGKTSPRLEKAENKKKKMKRARGSFGRVLCGAKELSASTLTSGQAFRWKLLEDGKTWRCPLRNMVVNLQWTEEGFVEYVVEPAGSMSDAQTDEFLRDYFRLDRNLEELIRGWKARDALFEGYVLESGLRQLRQDPFECLMSFICSQNNNISRIALMIDRFCRTFGAPIPSTQEFAFPTLEQLLHHASEEKLRELGFGYRAPYIVECVHYLHEEKGGASFLDSLRSAEKFSLEQVREELTAIKGVGLKVADCVALFSLDRGEVVPVDTHMWQVCQDRYLKGQGKKGNKKTKEQGDQEEDLVSVIRSAKSLTPRIYKSVSQHFTNVWGHEAGWAHSLCFNNKISGKGQKKQKK